MPHLEALGKREIEAFITALSSDGFDLWHVSKHRVEQRAQRRGSLTGRNWGGVFVLALCGLPTCHGSSRTSSRQAERWFHPWHHGGSLTEQTRPLKDEKDSFLSIQPDGQEVLEVRGCHHPQGTS